MNWDQIENKWAAMARRVRADWPGAMQDDASQPAPVRENSAIILPVIDALTDTQKSEAKATAVE